MVSQWKGKSLAPYHWHVSWGGGLDEDALGLTMNVDSMLCVVGYTGSFGNGSQFILTNIHALASCSGVVFVAAIKPKMPAPSLLMVTALSMWSDQFQL